MSVTVADLLLRLRDDTEHGILFEDQRFSWSEHVQASADRAAWLRSMFDSERPPHFGVLMDNTAEFSFLLGAAALSGSVLVGVNSTRRGAALAHDIALADTQFVITESRHLPLLDGLDLGGRRVIDIDSDEWTSVLRPFESSPVEADPVDSDDLLMLIFTSGTSGDPKAVRCTHSKVVIPGDVLATRMGVSADDTVYVSMPMFHSNSIMACWGVGLTAGSNVVIRRKFSASNFLPDVRRHGVTYASYVGKPLAYVLATPEQSDDADNSLRLMYGNEASSSVVAEFSKRFGVLVLDAFGSSEVGVSISPDFTAPAGAMGLLPEGVDILEFGGDERCPVAEFDADGRLLNADEAIGELVNLEGAGGFAGYYNNPEADAERMRGGKFRTGDLAYRDSAGYVYFAGRSSGWLRVDGENLAAGPIERILLRHPNILRAAVYGIPDPTAGDQVMAALVPRGELDIASLAQFLGEQSDLGPKQWPSYIRVSNDLPQTATFKVLTRTLQAEALSTTDLLYRRTSTGYQPHPHPGESHFGSV
ncbi:long-chain-fatty-acid--CoA ligase [Antrihabitans cavernicola]|uniref:AMP-binding protein n=1 Tax=Antrihabitans cavernicola TaxID=2495913 RepID=A0A5A7SAR7_9NOCA|nr:long-chain-fatty-acid--CoA ligase [Spelaeibacter cavernicola]KAA0021947.1 AMP-binding protein [Spelaeibacter cavernicola]